MHFLTKLFTGLFLSLCVACAVRIKLGDSLDFYLPIRSAPSALVSPTVLLPTYAYSQQFQRKELRDLGYDLSEQSQIAVERTGRYSGWLWGGIQAISFYLPFFYFRLFKRQDSRDTVRRLGVISSSTVFLALGVLALFWSGRLVSDGFAVTILVTILAAWLSLSTCDDLEIDEVTETIPSDDGSAKLSEVVGYGEVKDFERMPHSVMNWLALTCAFVCGFLVEGNWHPAFYDLGKIALCLSSAALFYQAIKSKQYIDSWTFGFIAVVYNPLLPLRMDRVAWVVIDVIAGVAFIGYLCRQTKLSTKLPRIWHTIKWRKIRAIGASFAAHVFILGTVALVGIGAFQAVSERKEEAKENSPFIETYKDKLIEGLVEEEMRQFSEERNRQFMEKRRSLDGQLYGKGTSVNTPNHTVHGGEQSRFDYKEMGQLPQE